MSQLVLPQRMGFNVGPQQMTFDSIMAKLYPPVRGPYLYRRGPGVSGLSADTLSYYDLLAQAGLQNCDPKDSACVSNNTAKQAAVEDLWVNKYMVTGAPADTTLTFQPQTAAQVNEFYNASNPTGGDVVDTRNIMAVNGQTAPSDFGKTPQQFFSTPAATPAPAPAKAAASAPVAKPNQSVPPTAPIVHATPPTVPSSSDVINAQTYPYQVPGGQALIHSGVGSTGAGMSSNTVLILAAVGVGLFLMMGAQR